MPLDKMLSRLCFTRDGFHCRHCNDSRALHPHHVIYKSHQGPDALNNLLTLCAQCHTAHHDGKLGIEVLAVLEEDLLVSFKRKKNWRPT